MKKALWIFMVVLWFALLVLLILSLTDIYPDIPLQKYRLAIGCSFLAASEFIRRLYGKLYS